MKKILISFSSETTEDQMETCKQTKHADLYSAVVNASH